MTDWEIGNDIMCTLIDKMNELAEECEISQPMIASALRANALGWGTTVNILQGDGICPENKQATVNFQEFVNKSLELKAR